MGILKDKRIFIIEDKPNNFAVAKILLEQHGALISFDRYGDKTLSRLKKFVPIDLILLDLMFPNNITGYDLFDLIRKEPEFQEVQIVAVSASDPSDAIPRTRAKGFAGFIAKPISYDFFAKQVSQILNKEDVWIGR